MWDLVPWPGIEPRPLALGGQSLKQRTTMEVLGGFFLEIKGHFQRLTPRASLYLGRGSRSTWLSLPGNRPGGEANSTPCRQGWTLLGSCQRPGPALWPLLSLPVLPVRLSCLWASPSTSWISTSYREPDSGLYLLLGFRSHPDTRHQPRRSPPPRWLRLCPSSGGARAFDQVMLFRIIWTGRLPQGSLGAWGDGRDRGSSSPGCQLETPPLPHTPGSFPSPPPHPTPLLTGAPTSLPSADAITSPWRCPRNTESLGKPWLHPSSCSLTCPSLNTSLTPAFLSPSATPVSDTLSSKADHTAHKSCGHPREVGGHWGVFTSPLQPGPRVFRLPGRLTPTRSPAHLLLIKGTSGTSPPPPNI